MNILEDRLISVKYVIGYVENKLKQNPTNHELKHELKAYKGIEKEILEAMGI